ncbi:uncharacterized protein LOC114714596 [Neltuma alba]|uniref:uncharacterized protein LOC114714596 n=1 Tax=Neltuma alba TaxID=207710 RepID=UPI0010A3C27B|nr:uncharacterized protein LOC114714596 [Prosopis alba]
MRSSKKIKNESLEKRENSRLQHWPTLGTGNVPKKHTSLSFADTLKGINSHEDNSNDKDDKIDALAYDSMSDYSPLDSEAEKKESLVKIREDPKRNFPTFHFSIRMKKRLYRAWRKVVIVKLLDRSIGYKALETRLQILWARRGVINLINIGYGYLVVKLSNREDYFNALTGGPWMIYDHYLTVRSWEPNFNPARAKIDKVAAWVRVPRVCLEYYDAEALTIIGNRIGETLKVDVNTSSQLRGHYARICALIDLGKQLLSWFSLDGEDCYLEYEGLHSLCLNCSVYG